MQVLLSIIIPVYNVRAYLNRCVESLLAQMCDDYEIILVDDGSTDGSDRICDQFAKNDTRIRVFHKANGGVSSARNLGLDIARGDLVLFVDSDDFVEEDFIATLVKSMSENGADACCCAFNVVNKNKTFIRSPVIDKKFDILLKEDIIKKIVIPLYGPLTYNESRSGFSWGWIYSRELIGSYRFPTRVKLLEDVCFNAMVLAGCKKIVLLNRPLYNYYIHGESATEKKRDDIWSQVEELLSVLTATAMETNIPIDQVFRRLGNLAGNRLIFAVRQQAESGGTIRKIQMNIKMMLRNPIFAAGFRHCAVGTPAKTIAFLILHKSYWASAFFAKALSYYRQWRHS